MVDDIRWNDDGLDDLVAKSLANGLVGNEFASRYRHIPCA